MKYRIEIGGKESEGKRLGERSPSKQQLIRNIAGLAATLRPRQLADTRMDRVVATIAVILDVPTDSVRSVVASRVAHGWARESIVGAVQAGMTWATLCDLPDAPWGCWGCSGRDLNLWTRLVLDASSTRGDAERVELLRGVAATA